MLAYLIGTNELVLQQNPCACVIYPGKPCQMRGVRAHSAQIRSPSDKLENAHGCFLPTSLSTTSRAKSFAD